MIFLQTKNVYPHSMNRRFYQCFVLQYRTADCKESLLPEIITCWFATGKDPDTIIKEQGLVQISDEGALKSMVAAVVEANPKSVEDYKAGKKKAMGFLVSNDCASFFIKRLFIL